MWKLGSFSVYPQLQSGFNFPSLTPSISLRLNLSPLSAFHSPLLLKIRCTFIDKQNFNSYIIRFLSLTAELWSRFLIVSVRERKGSSFIPELCIFDSVERLLLSPSQLLCLQLVRNAAALLHIGGEKSSLHWFYLTVTFSLWTAATRSKTICTVYS